MLCHPFGDPGNKLAAEELVKTAWWAEPTPYEHSHLVERLEWEFERSRPFQWDFEGPKGSGTHVES